MNREKVFHSIVGGSSKAAAILATLSLLVAPWIPKLGGDTGAILNVTLGPGDSGPGAISSNGDCGTSNWPQLFARFDNGCFVGVLGLVSASISVQKKGGEVSTVGLFFRNGVGGAGDLYQTDRIPVIAAPGHRRLAPASPSMCTTLAGRSTRVRTRSRARHWATSPSATSFIARRIRLA